jgi:hypothetical protein
MWESKREGRRLITKSAYPAIRKETSSGACLSC